MKYIPLRLFLASFTFLVGISASALFVFISSSKPDFAFQSVAFENTVKEIEISQTNKPKRNNGEIEIKYAWSLIGVDSLDGLFVVKNNSGKTIYYPGYPDAVNQENQHSWIKQNGKIKATIIGSEDLIEEQELKSDESITFSIPVPQNEKPFEAGFAFRTDGEQKEKIIWVKVKKQLKSYGFSCSEDIKKLENVLSETCISEID